jgi:hypothetical protein
MAGLFVSDPSAHASRGVNESAGKLTMTTLAASKNRFERRREFATLEVGNCKSPRFPKQTESRSRAIIRRDSAR